MFSFSILANAIKPSLSSQIWRVIEQIHQNPAAYADPKIASYVSKFDELLVLPQYQNYTFAVILDNILSWETIKAVNPNQLDILATHKKQTDAFWSTVNTALGVKTHPQVPVVPYFTFRGDDFEYVSNHRFLHRDLLGDAAGRFMVGNNPSEHKLLETFNHEAVHNSIPRGGTRNDIYHENVTTLLERIITQEDLEIPKKGPSGYPGVNVLIDILHEIDAKAGKNASLQMLMQGVYEFNGNMVDDTLYYVKKYYESPDGLGKDDFSKRLERYTDAIYYRQISSSFASPGVPVSQWFDTLLYRLKQIVPVKSSSTISKPKAQTPAVQIYDTSYDVPLTGDDIVFNAGHITTLNQENNAPGLIQPKHTIIVGTAKSEYARVPVEDIKAYLETYPERKRAILSAFSQELRQYGINQNYFLMHMYQEMGNMDEALAQAKIFVQAAPYVQQYIAAIRSVVDPAEFPLLAEIIRMHETEIVQHLDEVRGAVTQMEPTSFHDTNVNKEAPAQPNTTFLARIGSAANTVPFLAGFIGYVLENWRNETYSGRIGQLTGIWNYIDLHIGDAGDVLELSILSSLFLFRPLFWLIRKLWKVQIPDRLSYTIPTAIVMGLFTQLDPGIRTWTDPHDLFGVVVGGALSVGIFELVRLVLSLKEKTRTAIGFFLVVSVIIGILLLAFSGESLIPQLVP